MSKKVIVPLVGTLKESIVCLYSGQYALAKNTIELTKGEYAGELAMLENVIRLQGDDYCLESDSYITDNRGRKCMDDDIGDYAIVYSSHEEGYYHCDDVVFGWVSRRTEDYFEPCQEVYCNDQYYLDCDVASSHDVHWDEHYQEYRHADDMWCEDEDDEDDNGNESYHSMTRKNKITTPGWSIGFEVEKEDSSLVGRDADTIHSSTGWCKERDGSLDDSTGFEMVSPKFSLYDNKTILSSFESVAEFINAEKSTNCGGHIHVGHDEYSPDEIFEGLSGYFPLFYSLYNKRLNVDYCKGKNKSDMGYNKEKYSAVYVRNDLGTIEFRIISGVKNMTNLKWRLELMQIVCKGFCKSEIQVAKDMVNKNSKLHKHLMKVYTHEELLNKVNLFIKYSRQYNNKVITNIKPFEVTEVTEVTEV